MIQKIKKRRFSKKEIKDLTKAWLAISFAFSNIMTSSFFSLSHAYVFMISALTVGLGFILHELGHKLIAQKYGCFAEFKSWDSMLIVAVIMSFFGFIFAAPGAVMISGPIGPKRNGKISAAGPTINIALGALFFSLMFISDLAIISDIARIGSTINIWLGLFNLIPIWNFDGKKIWAWNRAYYIGLAVIGISILFLSSII